MARKKVLYIFRTHAIFFLKISDARLVASGDEEPTNRESVVCILG